MQPTGEVITGPFKPVLTQEGQAHPVTSGLAGSGDGQAAPTWGRWFRAIGGNKISGTTVMNGPGGRPLLVLDEISKGRVASLLSTRPGSGRAAWKAADRTQNCCAGWRTG